MKTFSGTFANGDKYMGVEKPEDAKSFFIGGICKVCNSQGLYHCIEADSCGNVKPALKLFKDDDKRAFLASIELPYGDCSILGTYQTKGEIDFPVDENWVEEPKHYKDEHGYLFYNNYTDTSRYALTKNESLLSLLDRDSRMAFPLEENPYGEKEPKSTKRCGAINDFCGYGEEYCDCSKLAKWREAESQVRPKNFLIILVK